MPGRVVLISGGTRGLGRAIASRFARAEEDHRLAVLFREDQTAAESFIDSFPPEIRQRIRTYQIDITDEAGVETTVRRVAADLGPITVLINNAFRSGRPPVKTHELEPRAFREDLDTNLVGHFLVTRCTIPHMLNAGFGRIIFIGSIAMRGEHGRVAYSVAKSALVGLSNTISVEYAKKGITSNVLSPGFVDTGAFARLSPEIQERALRRVAARRAATGEEIAEMAHFLASELSGYTTGQVITVDGGTR